MNRSADVQSARWPETLGDSQKYISGWNGCIPTSGPAFLSECLVPGWSAEHCSARLPRSVYREQCSALHYRSKLPHDPSSGLETLLKFKPDGLQCLRSRCGIVTPCVNLSSISGRHLKTVKFPTIYQTNRGYRPRLKNAFPSPKTSLKITSWDTVAPAADGYCNRLIDKHQAVRSGAHLMSPDRDKICSRKPLKKIDFDPKF